MSSDAQCAFFMQDREAQIGHDKTDIHTICERMNCKSPTKIGNYAAGPALEGTRCSMSDEKMVRSLLLTCLNEKKHNERCKILFQTMGHSQRVF